MWGAAGSGARPAGGAPASGVPRVPDAPTEGVPGCFTLAAASVTGTPPESPSLVSDGLTGGPLTGDVLSGGALAASGAIIPDEPAEGVLARDSLAGGALTEGSPVEVVVAAFADASRAAFAALRSASSSSSGPICCTWIVGLSQPGPPGTGGTVVALALLVSVSAESVSAVRSISAARLVSARGGAGTASVVGVARWAGAGRGVTGATGATGVPLGWQWPPRIPPPAGKPAPEAPSSPQWCPVAGRTGSTPAR